MLLLSVLYIRVGTAKCSSAGDMIWLIMTTEEKYATRMYLPPKHYGVHYARVVLVQPNSRVAHSGAASNFLCWFDVHQQQPLLLLFVSKYVSCLSRPT